MFENIVNFFKNLGKKEAKTKNNKDTAKERLHLVLMQDRANVSADFLELMKQEIIDVIKKYIDVDESQIDVKLTNKQNSDGTTGAPALYANIPIKSIKNEARKMEVKKEDKPEEKPQEKEEKISENKEETVEKVEEVEQDKNEVREKTDEPIKEEKKEEIKENKEEPESSEEKAIKEEEKETEKKEETANNQN